MQPAGPTYKRFLFLALVALLKSPTRDRVTQAWIKLGNAENDMTMRRNLQYLADQFDVIVELDKTLSPKKGGTYVIRQWSFIDSSTFLWRFRPVLRHAGLAPDELRLKDAYEVPTAESMY